MIRAITRTARRLGADKRGAAAVEMALSIGILTFVLAAAIDVSRAYSARLDLVQAAARSAELATSLGQVRTDYSFLRAEAEAAAATAGHDGATAAVDAWLECAGARQSQINAPCPAGQTFARYVSVNVTGRYVPLFGLAGIIAPSGVTLTGRAIVRIQ